MEALEQEGLLLQCKRHDHAVGPLPALPDDDRTAGLHPVVRQGRSRWPDPAIEAVEEGRTEFIPETWSKTYFEWMRNIHDWCISRQLWWGHRIPAWYCEPCGETVVAQETDPERCPRCGGALRQDEDVLDTWFSSALWPFSTLGWPDESRDLERYYPTRPADHRATTSSSSGSPA